MSYTEISEEIISVLRLGSKFSVLINQSKINVNEIIADVEKMLDIVEENKRNPSRAKIINIITNHLHRLYNKIKHLSKSNSDLLVTKAQ